MMQVDICVVPSSLCAKSDARKLLSSGWVRGVGQAALKLNTLGCSGLGIVPSRSGCKP